MPNAHCHRASSSLAAHPGNSRRPSSKPKCLVESMWLAPFHHLQLMGSSDQHNRCRLPIPGRSINVDCQFLVDQSNTKEVCCLTNWDGTQSQALKITFYSAKLPDSIKLEYQVFMVHPCVPSVRRCTTCNKLGHPKINSWQWVWH